MISFSVNTLMGSKLSSRADRVIAKMSVLRWCYDDSALHVDPNKTEDSCRSVVVRQFAVLTVCAAVMFGLLLFAQTSLAFEVKLFLILVSTAVSAFAVMISLLMIDTYDHIEKMTLSSKG